MRTVSVGYFTGRVLKDTYKAHRVIWAMHYGEWPRGQIDHINHDRSDNRIENLRDVTMSVNQRNAGLRVDNKSGYVGVRLKVASNRWVAYLNTDAGLEHIGTFSCATAAIFARKKASITNNYHENHGV